MYNHKMVLLWRQKILVAQSFNNFCKHALALSMQTPSAAGSNCSAIFSTSSAVRLRKITSSVLAISSISFSNLSLIHDEGWLLHKIRMATCSSCLRGFSAKYKRISFRTLRDLDWMVKSGTTELVANVAFCNELLRIFKHSFAKSHQQNLLLLHSHTKILLN